MARNSVSKSGSAGGGFRSKQVKQVEPRRGQAAQRVNPGGVSQLGSAVGNHASDSRVTTNYKGDKMIAGDLVRPGQPRLGNETAFTTQCGPGGSRQVSKSGSQAQHGPAAPGNPTHKRGTFE